MTQEPAVPRLDEAIRRHGAGDLNGARDIYISILAHAPGDVGALHGLALIAIDENLPEKAVPLLATCLDAAPENTAVRTAMGLALFKMGHAQEAAAQFLEAANRAPQTAEPRIHLARALRRLNRGAEALRILDETAQAFPGRADVWIAKGQEERLQNKPAEAEKSVRRAHALAPNDPNILNDLGVVVRAQGRTRDAVDIYRAALDLAPGNALAHGNLGNALTELGEMDAAEDHLRQAVARAPGALDHRCNLAIFLTSQDRPREALPLFEDVLMRAPTHTDAWTNLGVAQLDLGDVHLAEASIRRAIALQPKNAEAHYNLAWVLLVTGQWREGWEEYEWRWRMPHFSSKRRRFGIPRWKGELTDGTLLLHAEQGLGDAIQFARYAALAKERCRRLVLECPRPLVRLFETLPEIDVVAAGDPLPTFDTHLPLMSLPHIFETTVDAVPPPAAYSSPDIPAPFRLPATEHRRIGLVWAGSPDNKIDRRRSVPARVFGPLIDETASVFVSLQVGPRAAEITDLPRDRFIFVSDGQVKDFADTAAVIRQLDLVIGVDTAAIHLAGSLNVPAWLLVPFMPDYRWLLERDDTPWYPDMRLFRQENPGDWAEVMLRVRAALSLLQPS